jgi:hypothetical protein
MSNQRLRCYEYVNRPYAEVRDVLHQHPLRFLHCATASAAERARMLGSTLHANVAGIDVSVDVHVRVRGVKDEKLAADQSDVTRVEIGWEADRAPALFPVMHATLSAWPISSTETQLEIDGEYRPPLGPLGTAVNVIAGHRIAEAAVHRLLEDVVEEIRRELTTS